MFRAAIFDVDGTLIDSNDLHARAWERVFRDFGIELPLAVIRNQIGKGGDNLMPALLPPKLIEAHGEEIEAARGNLFRREYLSQVQPFPGVRELFEALREEGTRTVLASSGTEEEVRHHCELLGIGELIDSTTSGDDAAHSKPCPDIFAAALATLPGVRADEAVVVGDSPYDMQAAAQLGVTSIGVLCGGFDPGLLRWSGAATLVDGLWALRPRISEWLPEAVAAQPVCALS